MKKLLFITVLFCTSCVTYNFRETPSTKLALHEITHIYDNPITGLRTYRLDIPFESGNLDRKLLEQIPGIIEVKKDRINPYSMYYSICHICDNNVIKVRIDDIIKYRTKEDLEKWLVTM